MGTRNLTVVIVDGEYKVAQYGQWDGYPGGQGSTICEFIQTMMDLDKFKRAVRECTWISDAEHKQLWVECGAQPGSEFVGMDVSNKFKELYPHLSRDAGGDILNLIQDHGARKLQSSLNFAGDSLFCEWVYVLDLDNEVLEVYKRFNQSPLDVGERFADPDLRLDQEGEYAPVRLYRKFPFAIATPYAMTQLEHCGEQYDDDGNDTGYIDPAKKPDTFFVDPTTLEARTLPAVEPDTSTEVKVGLVLDAFDEFISALAEANDEELTALQMHIQQLRGR